MGTLVTGTDFQRGTPLGPEAPSLRPFCLEGSFPSGRDEGSGPLNPSRNLASHLPKKPLLAPSVAQHSGGTLPSEAGVHLTVPTPPAPSLSGDAWDTPGCPGGELAGKAAGTEKASKWVGPAVPLRVLEAVKWSPPDWQARGPAGPGRTPEHLTSLGVPACLACRQGAGPERGGGGTGHGPGRARGARGQGAGPELGAGRQRTHGPQCPSRDQPRWSPLWGRSSGPCGPTSRRWRPA